MGGSCPLKLFNLHAFYSNVLFGNSLGCLSMPVAVVFQFLPFYHVFHDLYGVHTEVCVGVMVALYAIIAWSGDRVNVPEARPSQQSKISSFHNRYRVIPL